MTNEGGKGKVLKRADPSTIQDKFLVGYQGWFTCGGDGEPVGPGHHGWLHWVNFPIPDGGHPNIDLWPDVSEYSPSELFPVPGIKYPSGEQAFLFSSRHPKTVQRHFNLMAKHGVDGAFLQRFATEVDVDAGVIGIRRIRDEVGQHVRDAAEKEGRVFAIMYDVTGLPANRVLHVIQNDWAHLIRNQGLLDSPNYLREKRKAVVALWGFGFEHAGHTPALVREVCNFISLNTPGGAYIVGGVPTHWRTHSRDADRDPGFVDVWMNQFDAISPWTIGRFKDEDEADHFAGDVMKGDIEFIKKGNDKAGVSGGKKIDYIPVVFPGSSGYNMTQGKWEYNGIKRNGGKFLWKQIFNARRLGVRIMYGAMWDEYDEGTALLPVTEKKRLLPKTDKFPFLALDEDGYDVPADWYMRICGFAAEGLRSERRIHDTFPSKELQDYWASRPKYEQVDTKCGDFVSGSSASGSGAPNDVDGQTYQDWLAIQKEKEDGPPPPPYTLEAEEPQPNPPTQQSQHAPIPPTASVPVGAAPHPQQPVQPQEPSQLLNHRPFSDHAASSSAAGALQSLSQAIDVHIPNSSHQPYAPSGSAHPFAYPQTQQPISSTIVNDPVSSLANDFGRQTLSSPSPGPAPGPISPTLQSQSRPPLHPNHPSAHSQSRPPPRPSPQSRPSTASPPTSTPTSPGPNATSFAPNQNQHPQAAPGPWAQAQWPPPDWQMNRPTQSASSQQQPYPPISQAPPHQQQPSYPPSGYPNSADVHQTVPYNLGANLSRPSSYTAGYGHQHNRPPSRPHASIGHGPRPGSSQSPTPSQPQSPTFGGHPPPAAGPPPATYVAGPNPSSYPGQSSTYPDQSSFGPPSSNTTFPGGPSFPSIPNGPLSGYGAPNAAPSMSGYPGQSPFPPHDQLSYPPSMPGISFPEVQKPGDDGYLNTGQAYQPHKYSGSSAYSNEPTTISAQFPSAGGSTPSNWLGNAPPTSPVPPPMPPRPTSSTQNSGSLFPTPSTSGGGAFGFALNAVDRVAGRETRAQLENLAQSGTKLFKKITR